MKEIRKQSDKYGTFAKIEKKNTNSECEIAFYEQARALDIPMGGNILLERRNLK